MITMQICSECGQPFQIYQRRARGQRYCPTCADRRQQRPTVVLRREALAAYNGVRIHSLPGEWRLFTAAADRDEPTWRMEARGEDYGDAWEGTIVIHARRPFAAGDVVQLRHMRAVHEVKRATWSRPTSSWTSLSGGPSSVTHSVPVPIAVPDEAIRAYALRAGEPGNLFSRRSAAEAAAEGRLRIEVVEEEREYVVLEPSTAPATYSLVWLEATSKYTLKGLGAQYAEAIDAPDAVWSMSVRGGVRTDRRHTVGRLLVLPAGATAAVESVGHGGGTPPATAPYTWRREVPVDPPADAASPAEPETAALDEIGERLLQEGAAALAAFRRQAAE